MKSSQIQTMGTTEKATVVIGFIVLVAAFCFPDFILLHNGAIVLAGMAIIIGRRFSGRLTVILSIATAAAFIASGIVHRAYPRAGNISYFLGMALACCVAITYFRVYLLQKRFKVANTPLTTK